MGIEVQQFKETLQIIDSLFRVSLPLPSVRSINWTHAVTAHRDVLSSSMTELHTPNLQLVAKGQSQAEGAEDEICKLVGLVLALAVQVSLRASSSSADPKLR